MLSRLIVVYGRRTVTGGITCAFFTIEAFGGPRDFKLLACLPLATSSLQGASSSLVVRH